MDLHENNVMDEKHENKKIEALIEENTFLKKLIQAVPASVHVLEINENLETKPYWLTSEYTEVTGLDQNIRKQMGFARPENFYHGEDVDSILTATRQFINKEKDRFAILCRVKKHINKSEWLYVRGGRITIEEGKHHMAILLFPINDKAVYNHLKLDIYLKEITRLRNQLAIAKLTRTEIKVVELLAKGLSTKEVANRLYRSFDTINNHRRSIFKKLGIHKISELVSFANENGLV